MKTAIRRENDEFLVISLKHVSGLTGHANLLGTPKLWEIAHENGHKTRKRRVFGHNCWSYALEAIINVVIIISLCL